MAQYAISLDAPNVDIEAEPDDGRRWGGRFVRQPAEPRKANDTRLPDVPCKGNWI